MGNIPEFNTGWSPDKFVEYQKQWNTLQIPRIDSNIKPFGVEWPTINTSNQLVNNLTSVSNPTKSSLVRIPSKQTKRATGKLNTWLDKNSGIITNIGSTIGAFSGTDLPDSDKAVREGVRSTIGQFGPWGAVISAASGVVDAVGDLTGTNLDTIDSNAAERAGVKGAAAFNKIMNMIPGNSMVWGLFGKDTHKANFSSEAQSLGSGFGGTIQKLQDAQALGGKHMLFGKGKMNNFIEEANRLNTKLTNMAMDNKRSQGNYGGQMQMMNSQNAYSGHTPGLTFAKKGGIIPELESARESILALQNKTIEETSETQKFQLGGKMNMIVTGALHARKHNLEELNPNLEGEITKKGIPVVVMNEGGEVQGQQAEVESQELVLQIDTTKTIEDYYNEYNSTDSKTEKNKIALECGKFLVNELLKNTDDPDKLIKKTV